MKARHVALASYFAICAVALVWPGYEMFGNSIEPYVLGLPLSFAWNIGWVVMTFLVMGAYHLSGSEEG